MVESDLFSFLTDEDFPHHGHKRPETWSDAVEAFQEEMVTHPVILSAALLFSIQINIIDWQGGSSVLPAVEL